MKHFVQSVQAQNGLQYRKFSASCHLAFEDDADQLVTFSAK